MSEMPASPTPVPSAANGQPPFPDIPGYRILQAIGTGGTSVVYRAQQLSLDRPVALKVLSPDLAPDEEARAAFQIGRAHV